MSDHNKITFALKYLPISLLGLWHVTIAELDILLLWQDFIIELKTNSNLRFWLYGAFKNNQLTSGIYNLRGQ